MYRSIGDSTRGRVSIRFGTYIFCYSRNIILGSALIWMSKANMDLGIFQETKLTNGLYTRGSAGYSIVTPDATKKGYTAGLQFSTSHHCAMQWRPSSSSVTTLSDSSW